MHLSRNWLNDHVDLSGVSAAELAELLTMRTALIEGWVDQAALLEGVVVGEVVTCRPHPDADKLSLCTVDAGAGEALQVVCGAPNVAAGQRIVYAPVGTRLPNGMKLKKAKIRGVESHGMICAEDELGLGPEHDGILVLEPGVWGAHEPGTPIDRVPGLCDVVFEIDNQSVTHRPDLWGHRGFARELAAILGRPLRPLDLDASLGRGGSGPEIELADPEGCPLYAGLCVEGVTAATPDRLRFRLVACGMRPLGLAVDLSNYVMLELGQPTHPFDRDTLAGDRIVVRRAEPGETLTTLDGVERALEPDDVLIADGRRGVALAGIMGGAETEVGEATSRLLLESASFDPARLRRTSSRLGLRSEALARFEKALDPGLVEQSLRRYAHLLRALDPGAILADHYVAAGDAAAPAVSLELDPARVSALLGRPVDADAAASALGSLGFGVERVEGGRLAVTVPSWRATRDVGIPEDLVEEVGRLLGYDGVPTRDPSGPLRLGARAPAFVIEERLRDLLAGPAALTECLTYSMIPDAALAACGWDEARPLPRLTRPLQQDAARLRPSPAPGLLWRLEGWLRQQERVGVFEVGRGYELVEPDPAAEVPGLRESREVVVLIASRDAGRGDRLVREVKGVAEAALACHGLPAAEFTATGPESPSAPWFHPRKTARVAVDGVEVGRLGAVSPQVLQRLDVEGRAALLVLDVEALAGLPTRPAIFSEISRFPPVRIDLAFVAPYGLGTDALVEAMRRAGPRTLRAVEPFDVYRGKGLADDERSLAFHLVFQAKDRTLTDDDVGKARDRIVQAAEALGARLR